MSLVAPSPSRTIMRASCSADVEDRALHRSEVRGARVDRAAAGLTRGHQHDHVVGRRVRVHRDAVEGRARSRTCSAALHASEVSGASVVMTPSIVAMLGAIMPLPLAMPPTVTVRSPSVERDRDLLGERVGGHDGRRQHRVAPAPAERRDRARIPPSTMSSTGSGTPMTPVDATTTSCGSHASASPTTCAVSTAAASPWAPVQAFALPALMTTARATPDAMCRA